MSISYSDKTQLSYNLKVVTKCVGSSIFQTLAQVRAEDDFAYQWSYGLSPNMMLQCCTPSTENEIICSNF